MGTEAGDFIKVFKVWNFEAPQLKKDQNNFISKS